MTALPHQGYLITPIDWQGSVKKITMETGSLKMSSTVGIRPWTESATLLWVLPKADALALLNQFKAGFFNEVFTYTCNIRGEIKLRPTDSFSLQEREDGRDKVTLAVGFDVV
ncbi:hypothetical protein [Novosphingobium sp. PY1]|uniref:hypothetical protein n=1 Tax=Novosphingobium sp. PY1 TaxID=1882221 RepID=UPI001A905298|nr:hypothetical protein [Novosphingobium sp. PY1]GFM27168.1 uncharacterized protein PY1_contig-01-29 [Novosphingobium sp. PY1]